MTQAQKDREAAELFRCPVCRCVAVTMHGMVNGTDCPNAGKTRNEWTTSAATPRNAKGQIQSRGKYGLRRPEIAPNTRVRNVVSGRIGTVAWLCNKACYRVRYDDGNVFQTHESQLEPMVTP